jgi:hypothetical protein
MVLAMVAVAGLFFSSSLLFVAVAVVTVTTITVADVAVKNSSLIEYK